MVPVEEEAKGAGEPHTNVCLLSQAGSANMALHLRVRSKLVKWVALGASPEALELLTKGVCWEVSPNQLSQLQLHPTQPRVGKSSAMEAISILEDYLHKGAVVEIPHHQAKFCVPWFFINKDTPQAEREDL